jgi:hypothetical protein
VHDCTEAVLRHRAADIAHKLQTAGGNTDGPGTGTELTVDITHATREFTARRVAFSHGVVRGSRCT